MSCGIGCNCGSDLALHPPIWPLAWEPPYATGMTLKRQKKKKKSKLGKLIKKKKPKKVR